MSISSSVPGFLNGETDGGSSERNARQRSLASSMADRGREGPGVLAAMRRSSGLASLERRLAGATRSGEVMEALLAATRDIVGPGPAYAAYADGEDDAVRLLRRGGSGTQSRLLPGERSELASAPRGDSSNYWQRVLRVARDTLASPAEPTDAEWTTFPLNTLEGTFGAVSVMLPTSGGLAPDEELGLRTALDLSAEALRRVNLRRERDALRRELDDAGAQIERLRERVMLSESLAAIGELVSSVAHELNNPLTSVIGFAQLLQTIDANDDIKADLAIIDSEARRCQRIVQNLLGLARQQGLDLTSVPVNELIHRTMELKAYSLRIDNIETQVDLDPRLPPVYANPCKLQQALLNLVNNAHEAMTHAHGGGTLSICSAPALLDGNPAVCVSIADDGPGVPMEVRPRLFEPFFTTKRPQNGTGLGLTISRRIAEECGGRLTLDETYTVGAKFDLVLPIDDPSSAHPEAAAEDARARHGGGARVLLVDDELDLVDLVTRVLAEDGHQVEHAAGGREALQRLANDDYDLVLLDVRMPGLSGQDVHAVICQDYPGLAHRVILTTGDVVCQETAEWLQATGCPVLEKPFNVAQLRSMVTAALGDEIGGLPFVARAYAL